ncbi:MAG: Trk system potassium transporter TrkA [Actinomycetota bacterium]|nr:Trk system potassium transporter TrkA [Actinomycetota bacterium]
MRVVLVGAGEVGFNAARMLSDEGNDVVLIEQDEGLIERATEKLDALVMQGNGASPRVLREAGVKKAGLLVAATGSDEANIIACLAAKAQGVERTAARIHNPDYYDPREPFMQEVLGIDFVIHTEQVATEEIKAALLIPGVIDVETFAGGCVQVVEVILHEDSPAVGRAVRDVDLPERSLVLGGVRRGKALMSRGDTVLEAKDHVFLIGETRHIPDLVRAVATKAEPVRNVTIFGGGRIGLRLALALEESGIAVKVVEKDEARARYVAAQLKRGLVLHDEGVSRDFLLQERVDRTDAFVAVTGDDRANLLAAMYARQLGAALTIAGLARGEFAPLADALGVDITVSPRLLAAGAISRFVRQGDVVAVTLLESGARMMEMRVPLRSRISGRPLSEAGFPKGAIVGMVVRDGEPFIPSGKDVLEPGDDAVVFTVEETVKKVERLFTT